MSAPTESDEPSALNSTNLSDDITPDQSISNVGSNSHRPRTRKRTAWVWNHMPDLDPETLYYSKDDRIEWRCSIALQYTLNLAAPMQFKDTYVESTILQIYPYVNRKPFECKLQ